MSRLGLNWIELRFFEGYINDNLFTRQYEKCTDRWVEISLNLDRLG
jgi:hypothetical protein